MCHSCRYAIISHQDFVRLNSNPFMKIIRVLNPITWKAIFPCSIPARHLHALFCYLVSTFDHSFLKVFLISQLILDIFQPFCSLVMPFHNAPKTTRKYFTFLSIWYIIWSYPTLIEFCVHLLLIKIKHFVLSRLINSLLISFFLL